MSQKDESSPVNQFLAINNVRELADFLGISYRVLTFLLYRKPADSKYKAFTISKKKRATEIDRISNFTYS
jgi:hypothetical protein